MAVREIVRGIQVLVNGRNGEVDAVDKGMFWGDDRLMAYVVGNGWAAWVALDDLRAAE